MQRTPRQRVSCSSLKCIPISYSASVKIHRVGTAAEDVIDEMDDIADRLCAVAIDISRQERLGSNTSGKYPIYHKDGVGNADHVVAVNITGNAEIQMISVVIGCAKVSGYGRLKGYPQDGFKIGNADLDRTVDDRCDDRVWSIVRLRSRWCKRHPRR